MSRILSRRAWTRGERRVAARAALVALVCAALWFAVLHAGALGTDLLVLGLTSGVLATIFFAAGAIAIAIAIGVAIGWAPAVIRTPVRVVLVVALLPFLGGVGLAALVAGSYVITPTPRNGHDYVVEERALLLLAAGCVYERHGILLQPRIGFSADDGYAPVADGRFELRELNGMLVLQAAATPDSARSTWRTERSVYGC